MPRGADFLTSVDSGNIWVELGTLKLCVCVFWTGLNRFLLQRRQGVCSDVCLCASKSRSDFCTLF